MKNLCLFSLALICSLPSQAAIEFNRDVRPILSDNCFACHGFDAKKRKADLRLDTPEGAYAAIDGVHPIKPGSPSESSVMQRILTKDQDDLMPPPDSHKKLTAAQITTLEQWIKEGAVYQKHWAFEAPRKGTLTSIDAYIEESLRTSKLKPTPEATPEELIRRVTLDLTGLPPTPAEVDAFLNDSRAQGLNVAYAARVDQLLQSPRYGEHMARYWLDLARYGDTHGLHLDNERSIWPYRDWVVNAFNDNLPFDQFTVWQLAGDLLPDSTREQQIATGFNRCNVTTSEGGSINEEWIHRYAVDRTETTVAVWMGLTAGCAVCHDHKYDPLTQKEFYSLYAFFNSTADPAMDGNIFLTPPILRLTSDTEQKNLTALEAAVAKSRERIRDLISSVQYTDPATLKDLPPPQTVETVWFDDAFPAKANVEVNGAPTTFVTKAEGPVFSGEKALKRTAKGVAQDFFTSGADITVPANAKISVQCWVDEKNQPKSVMLQFHTGGWNHRAVWGDEGAIPFGKVRTTERAYMGSLPEKNKWVTLTVNADKLGLKPGMKITGFAFTQYDGTVYWDKLSVSSRVDHARDPQWSWSLWVKKNQGRRVAELPQDLQTLVRGKKASEWTPEETKKVKDWWFENEYAGANDLLSAPRAETLRLEQQKKAAEEAIPATFIMADLPEKRDAHLMLRGQYDRPGEKVTRATPAVLPALKKTTPGPDANRLDLARWLVDPAQPLTSRVQVNRLWQQFFGTGLVKTSGDFGSQGEPPSHPALLDWLSVTYREQGWDTKRLIKTIVTSRAYRRSSRITDPAFLELDPENRLLARGSRFRLDAEVLRDQALYVSGLLIPTLGGKPVKPYQPENIWEPVAYSGSNTRYYVQDHGDALYRRSLYTFIKRTAPAPTMANFDGPSREASCTRRERSNTPMQALQLMNDIQHVEAARQFATRILQQASDNDQRITFGWRTVTGRHPSAQEAQVVAASHAQHVQRYQKDPGAAEKLITVGESKPAPTLDKSQLAAWTLTASLLLNLDEALTR
jgi:hypothetical protein